MKVLYKIYLKVSEISNNDIRFTSLYNITNVVDCEYVLYAITDNKNILKEFNKTRDISKIVVIKDNISEYEYDKIMKTSGMILDYYDFETVDANNNPIIIKILTTKKEYLYTVKDYYSIKEMVISSIVNPKNPYYIYKTKYISALSLIYYDKLYRNIFYTSDNIDIKIDMYKLLISRNSILFKSEDV